MNAQTPPPPPPSAAKACTCGTAAAGAVRQVKAVAFEWAKPCAIGGGVLALSLSLSLSPWPVVASECLCRLEARRAIFLPPLLLLLLLLLPPHFFIVDFVYLQSVLSHSLGPYSKLPPPRANGLLLEPRKRREKTTDPAET